MIAVDKAILDTDKVICKNISVFDSSDRGLLSQNILAQLRNFVEYIATKIYAQGADLNPNDYDLKCRALDYIKTQGKLRFLSSFHDLLQKSVSHYTMDGDGSERLMLKYYKYLIQIKKFLHDTYNLDVLNNINKFPLNTDTELADYYEKIAQKINNPTLGCPKSKYTDRYYIQKIKPFFVNEEIYYEVTFTAANAKVSKFDRTIAFTKHDILSNYSVRLSIHNDTVKILDKDMNIQVIDDWSVSIRPCELNNFADIFGVHPKIEVHSKEYVQLMQFLTRVQMPISELVECSEQYYNLAKAQVINESRTTHIFDILDKCRNTIINKKDGANVIKYLLYKLNNRIIKSQRSKETCYLLSDFYLNFGCVPFDKMPFCTSLKEHSPRIVDLLECLSTDNKEHELFARHIINNTENKGLLFTPKKEIVGFDNIDRLIKVYNDKLYMPKHQQRQILNFSDNIYIKGYADDSAYIIKRFQELAKTGVSHYTSSVDSWLKQGPYVIDCDEKKEVLKNMFSDSCVALIYGSAGTGKSTLINHLSNFFSSYKKVCLANTHPAINNLKRKITSANCEFDTIAHFISKNNLNKTCDILIVDECSTVSNKDMREVLEKTTFKLLILVGDIFQIESIRFGNWFEIARHFIKKTSVFELKKPYRATKNELLTVWDRVRNFDAAILEPLVKYGYSMRLNDSIFNRTENDEIILCLNYDGLYGINNINRFLQNNNPNPAVQWGINIYKIGDRILFNEANRFSPLIYNNSKGRIVNIEIQEEDRIWFDIELDFAINQFSAALYDFQLIDTSEKGNSIIRFSVDKNKNTDEDDDLSDVVVPFQVAYAVSIHKAQGLEYNTVKVVITNEVEEQITHNIFYTAITRAKENLKIYWSPETENSVLSNIINGNSSNRDVHLLSRLYSL